MTQQALHTWIGGFSAILLCKSSQARSAWMGTVSGQPFSGLSRDVRKGSGQGSGWATRTFTELSLSHSYVALAVCLGSSSSSSSSCWKINLWPSLRSWALWNRFSLRISLYFAPFSFPSTLTSLPVPAAEKHPNSMGLLPAHFTFGMLLCRWWAELVSFKHDA